MILRPEKGRFKRKDCIRIKIISLGDSLTGKSCLIKRHCERKFVTKYIPTIGVDYGVRPVEMEGITVKVNFWDLSGNPEYLSIRNEFYKDAQGIVLVYDVTSKSSLASLESWMKELKDYSNGKPCVGVLCGNKVDKKRRSVSRVDAEVFAKSHNLRYFETSAKSGKNVDEVFEMLYQVIFDKMMSTSKSAEKKR
mmetsp:Transcript_22172/g.33042  ORF Transcript_22172/g.33042 Transcript_22172/m.33042 type:complete len:194 (+) Transcript_22172:59-640(+)|eukprot:CAMPEP_0167754822 /NCGR_PEP_ID=MMETSP0110_2-20121227/8484_1 /TAXON_ID=629695 /ORGANISM="Gymnochlora sp., Strain CCMP2014" /LENGTH=193 /DNA_ID=CAMNT_0007640745 /DNA_START=43 /DNA_END=624 /DNA_ORIENTATION=+